MKVDIIVWLKGAEKGKTQNWVNIRAYCGFFGDSLYTIEFSGAEIITNIPLLDSKLEKLRKLLVEDFGFGPYDVERINRIINDGKDYSIA